MWIMISFKSETKLFSTALVEVIQLFHIYKKVKE